MMLIATMIYMRIHNRNKKPHSRNHSSTLTSHALSWDLHLLLVIGLERNSVDLSHRIQLSATELENGLSNASPLALNLSLSHLHQGLDGRTPVIGAYLTTATVMYLPLRHGADRRNRSDRIGEKNVYLHKHPRLWMKILGPRHRALIRR